jgi:CheY-like chemotaxis protein
MAKENVCFTTGQVSKILGISEKTVRNYCDRGKLRCEQTLITNYRKIRREHLISFLKENGLPLELIEKESEKKILIVDDEETILEIMLEFLSKAFPKAIIETATDGYDACIKAGVLIPDIIVLDLQLPKADGFEVCKSIRQVEYTKHAEIIVVSAYLDDENKRKLKEFGVNHMMVKPFKHEELVMTVKACY